ncbi:uncharacterized protein LOC116177372 isoform X2 [Photinus pyralis]|uniref:uncharacterized protein LOC116177372 isoform X2 n=1 Tax=Photinus pyralis TaxID=7054 RepID=UPI00126729AD|nr:uncharacterized protein LOC116177372 isoform X2 [Photinus pyralis]
MADSKSEKFVHNNVNSELENKPKDCGESLAIKNREENGDQLETLTVPEATNVGTIGHIPINGELRTCSSEPRTENGE